MTILYIIITIILFAIGMFGIVNEDMKLYNTICLSLAVISLLLTIASLKNRANDNSQVKSIDKANEPVEIIEDINEVDETLDETSEVIEVGSKNNTSELDQHISEEPKALSNTEIDVPAVESKSLSVDALSTKSTDIGIAESLSYKNSIVYEGQTDKYTFTAPYDGRYRAEISNLLNGTNVRLNIVDETGNVIGQDSNCSNGKGITVRDLKAGNTYEVQVVQKTGKSDYSLTIWKQKPTVELNGYTLVKDSTEFSEQRNVYTFTVPVDGNYYFGLFEMMNGTEVELILFNHLGETVEADMYCKNGEGITAYKLKAGDTYELQVRQKSGFTSYDLYLGYQKKTVDISNLTQISDSIEYASQRNVYSFIVPRDGRYSFELSEMQSGTEVQLIMLNHLEETVESNNYCKNGEGITVYGLKAGDVYTIQIRHRTGLSKYTMTIGQQKETIDISGKTIIHDSVQFTNQRNVYMLTANNNGEIGITISDMNNNLEVELIVFNNLGEVVDSNNYCKNGGGVRISNTSTGTIYEVQVRQKNGKGTYTMLID